MEVPYTRRTALKLAGAGFVGAGVLGHASAAEGGGPPFEAQRESATNATADYADIGEALADGYEILGPYVPDMGWHVVDFSRIEKADERGVNIRQPQALTYNPQWKLGSLEYIVPYTEDGDPPDVFNDEGEELDPSESEGWHAHHGAQHIFANGNDQQDDRSDIPLDEIQNPANWVEFSDENPGLPDENPGLQAGDCVTADFDHDGTEETRVVDFIVEHDGWWTLHAWFHFENPEGVFAPFNHSEEWDPLEAPPHH